MTFGKYETRDMRDPTRVEDFINAFDDLCALEKQNGTFEDPFHANRRNFAAKDIEDRRIRDVSQTYVLTRSTILATAMAKKEVQEAIIVSLGTKNNHLPIPTYQPSQKMS